MFQRSSRGKPCGEMLHEPPTANREKEWEMRGSEQTKESREPMGEKCFLFSNCLIMCWNDNLYNLEACCCNIILHAATHTHTQPHISTLGVSGTRTGEIQQFTGSL